MLIARPVSRCQVLMPPELEKAGRFFYKMSLKLVEFGNQA